MSLRINFKKSAIYDLLVYLTDKNKKSIKMYFYRNWLDPLNSGEVKGFLIKNNIIECTEKK